jgi:tRNA(Ile)-lysidine synthase
VSGLDPDLLFASLAEVPGILAAVSGGPDSMALMGLLARWTAGGTRPPVTVATVDHGLRSESTDEAALVARVAADLSLPHRTLIWSGEKPSRGLPEAAREARYALLVALARQIGASHLITAHTQDDQAETVLMRLARGSGPGGLAGMRPLVERDGVLHARPLLAAAKAELVSSCRENGWPFIEDPTNRDERFARPRWRRLRPELAAEGLTPKRLARLAERMGRAEEALNTKAREALERALNAGEGMEGLVMQALAAEPLEIALRVIALVVAERRVAEEPLRLERLEACTEALLNAHRAGEPLRRTLGGVVLSVDHSGRLTLTPEPPRRRGRTSNTPP